MLTLGSDVFLLDPSAVRGVDLVTGDVVEVYSDRCAVVVDDAAYAPEIGSTAIMFYTFGRGFFRQEVRVRETLNNGTSIMVRLSMVRSSELADRRGEFRTTTVLENLRPQIQGQTEGAIVDISEQGLAVVVSDAVANAEVLEVSFDLHGEHFAGSASIQNRRTMPDGRIRCGLRVDPGASQTGTLRLGLLRLSIDLQREMLRQMQCRAS